MLMAVAPIKKRAYRYALFIPLIGVIYLFGIVIAFLLVTIASPQHIGADDCGNGCVETGH